MFRALKGSSPRALLTYLFFGCVFGLAWLRLYYGVNFADEAYYAVLSQRFALGDRPFVDEINLRQSAGLLTAPLYALYLHIVGSTDGVILFLRRLYFALQCIVAISAFRLTLRVGKDISYALLAAAIPLSFIPFSTPACGYNNLACMLFTLGVLFSVESLLQPDSRRPALMAGAILGLACVAYPPLVLPVTILGFSLVFQQRGNAPQSGYKSSSFFFLGLGCTGVIFMIDAGPGLVGGLEQALAYERMFTQKRDAGKLFAILKALVLQAWPFWLVASLGFIPMRNRQTARTAWLMALISIVLIWFHQQSDAHYLFTGPHDLSINVSIYIGLAAGGFLIAMPRAIARPFFLVGWLPSLLAGFTMAMASDNGWTNAGLGLLAATTLLPLFATQIDLPLSPRPRLALFVAVALIPLALTRINFQTYLGDGAILLQPVEIQTGPYKGIFTTTKKARLAESLTREIRAFAGPGERMLAYYSMPAAYLSVPTRPAMQTSWTDRRAIIPPLLPYYDDHRTGHGIVVVVDGESGTSTILQEMIERPQMLLKDAGAFRIYREPPRE